MSTTLNLHTEAMELFDQAQAAIRKKQIPASLHLFRRAFQLEAAAADSVADDLGLEPTRAVLHRSAASIALFFDDTSAARKYLDAALAGNAPLEIMQEIHETYQRIEMMEGAAKKEHLSRRSRHDRTANKLIIDRYKREMPVDIVSMAIALGVYVVQGKIEANASAEIFADKDSRSGFTIRVQKTDHLHRKRFSVAHELAHFLRHRNRITNKLRDDRMYRSGLGDQLEAEANRTASDLLMPSAGLRSFKAEGITDPKTLAARFKVSLEAMEYRLGYRSIPSKG